MNLAKVFPFRRPVGLDAGHFFLDNHRAEPLREIAHDVAPWLA